MFPKFNFDINIILILTGGSLAQQLVSSGVLTPKMLGKLQQEWTQLQSQPESKRSSQKKNSKKHKRNKK